MTARASRLLAAAFVLAATAACEQFQPKSDTPAPPKPAAPQITEDMLRDRAKEQLTQGAAQFQAGEFDNAIRTLTLSLDHGLLPKADQARARKLIAFSHCVSGRENQCRDEFRKAFEIYPEFSLTPAEDGHPIWGPVYRNVRTQLITEREAAAARSRGILPLGKAEQMLADGLVKYDAAEYEPAVKLLEAALKEGLKDKADQVRAMKHVAFTHCLQGRYGPCRAEFNKIWEVDAAFDLTPAEAGHPSWTRTFASARRAHQDRLAREAREKAAREAREKSKSPPAAAPKKN